jgi:hypothetical protein
MDAETRSRLNLIESTLDELLQRIVKLEQHAEEEAHYNQEEEED